MRNGLAVSSILCLIGAAFCITQPVHATERISIPRTQEKGYCPTLYNDQLCSPIPGDRNCVLGVLTPIETPSPSVIPSRPHGIDSNSSLNADLISELINAHRATLGLPAFEKDDTLCTLAQERGPELYDEIFVTHTIHGGLSARNIPYWITENMKYGPDEQEVVNWWLHSPIHRKAIEGNFQYSCGVCVGHACAQLFTSYVPK